MKHPITTTALALLLAAGASHAALAQDDGGHGRRGPGGDRGGDRVQGQGQGWQGRGRDQASSQGQAPAAAAPVPQAAPAPQSAPQRASRATVAEGFRRQRDEGAGQGFRGDQPRPEAPRSDPARVEPPRAGGQGFDRGRGDDRPRGENRQGGDRRWDQGDRNRGSNDRRDGDRADQRQWERGRYPPVYRSEQRFRIDRYRAPSGYYFRQWAFGDFLPRGWYGPDYLLSDFDYYGLPYPPPGYQWVRVGEDALLIDRFTGRVVQVVRYIFW